MSRRTGWVVFAIGFILLLLAWETFVSTVIQPALGAYASSSRTEYMPCAGNDTERNCVWDQRHGGEGDGFSWSFYVDRQGHVYRLPHHIAHALVYGNEQ